MRPPGFPSHRRFSPGPLRSGWGRVNQATARTARARGPRVGARPVASGTCLETAARDRVQTYGEAKQMQKGVATASVVVPLARST